MLRQFSGLVRTGGRKQFDMMTRAQENLDRVVKPRLLVTLQAAREGIVDDTYVMECVRDNFNARLRTRL